MTWPVIVIWIMIIVGMFRPPVFMLYMFFVVQAFGGMSLLPVGIAGNVPVDTICASLLIAKTFVGRRRLKAFLNFAFDVRKFGLLTLFCVYVVATALIYPRLFEGRVSVYALNYASNITPLRPSSSNVTQSIYVLVSVGMAFVAATSGQNLEFRKHFLRAALLGATLILATGFIDMALGDIGKEALLAPFHTSTYRLLDTATVAGQRRVIGFMPEASVFGGACCASLAFLIFNRNSYEGRLRKWAVPAVAVGLAYMVYASTSSGAYVGLGLIGGLVGLRFLLDMMLTERFTPGQLRLLIWGITGLIAAGLALVFLPRSITNHLATLINETLFQKTQSFSYLQRSSWTQAAAAAFWATDGVGVGVGSVRTSSWIVNFAASTGIVGLLLFGSFLLRTLLGGKSYPDPKSRMLANGLKLAVLPGLVVNSLSGTTPDPGPELVLILGLIYALKQPVAAALPARAGPARWKPGRPVEPQGGSEAGIA